MEFFIFADFAVTTKTKIRFFNEHWQEILTAAHQFDELTALTLDESQDVLYFSDKLHLNGSIFSLHLANNDNTNNYNNNNLQSQEQHDAQHIIENVVQRIKDENIAALAFDPLENNLYWTDSLHRKIYYANVNAEITEANILLDVSSENAIPDGLALDICRRKLYWTNKNFKNASIESIELDAPHARQLIISKDLYLPHGIIVDQMSDRIYWVDDQQGMHFTVESANLDGTDRQVMVHGLNNEPLHLTVTHDDIFWTDSTHAAIWSHAKSKQTSKPASEELEDMDYKDETAEDKPNMVIQFTEQPYGIVARTRFLTNFGKDAACANVIATLKQRLQSHVVSTTTELGVVPNKVPPYCLNGADELLTDSKRKVCVCKMGWDGARCETNLCHNFCMHGGSCSMSMTGAPSCSCSSGYYGRRCQANKCAGYCLNDGKCHMNDNTNVPECDCRENFGGARCEHNSTEICALYCHILKYEPEADVPFGCNDM